MNCKLWWKAKWSGARPGSEVNASKYSRSFIFCILYSGTPLKGHPWNKDTSLIRTSILVPRVSVLERFHCTHKTGYSPHSSRRVFSSCKISQTLSCVYNHTHKTKLLCWWAPKLCPTQCRLSFAGMPERTPVASGLWSLLHWYHAVGLSLFAWASLHQYRCHKILANLRAERNNFDHSYYLPKGDWFEYVSCPHYLAEVLIYVALLIFFVATDWRTNWWLVVVFTTSTLLLSARQVSLWYKLKFEDYPTQWKIILPGVYWYWTRKTNVCIPGCLIPRLDLIPPAFTINKCSLIPKPSPRHFYFSLGRGEPGNEASYNKWGYQSEWVLILATSHVFVCSDIAFSGHIHVCSDIAFSGHTHP